jgi:hypothetical protein
MVVGASPAPTDWVGLQRCTSSSSRSEARSGRVTRCSIVTRMLPGRESRIACSSGQRTMTFPARRSPASWPIVRPARRPGTHRSASPSRLGSHPPALSRQRLPRRACERTPARSHGVRQLPYASLASRRSIRSSRSSRFYGRSQPVLLHRCWAMDASSAHVGWPSHPRSFGPSGANG